MYVVCVSMRVCECVYVSMCNYVSVFKYACVYMYMCVCVVCVIMCMCIYVQHVWVCACVCEYMSVRVCVNMCECVSVCMCIWVCAHEFMCVWMCVFACVWVWVYIWVYDCECVCVISFSLTSVPACIFRDVSLSSLEKRVPVTWPALSGFQSAQCQPQMIVSKLWCRRRDIGFHDLAEHPSSPQYPEEDKQLCYQYKLWVSERIQEFS